MAEKVTIPYHLVVPGGKTDEVVLYTVPATRTLRIKRIVTYFPAGNYGELYLSFWVGIYQVYPKKDELNGDQVVWDDDVDITIYSGEDLKLKYRNDNPTETREAFIHVIGELE